MSTSQSGYMDPSDFEDDEEYEEYLEEKYEEHMDDLWDRECARIEEAYQQRTARVNLLVLRFAATLALLAIRARERANAPSGAAAKAAVARNADQAKRQRRA